ncbi:hypothetical protein AYK24_09815 [Thermoplasmatales archaeon SG8-52-4]|nr:MAG: hypothetical protein AYK24_09815 [Thermoplasmatales archaeon SG8-52-4]
MIIKPDKHITLRETIDFMEKARQNGSEAFLKGSGSGEVVVILGTLREEAQAYRPQEVLNVADLEAVPLDNVTIQDGEGEDSEGKKFSYKFFELTGKKYRVPSTVFEEIQKIIKLRPDVKYVKVSKTGEGKKTRYSVDIVEEKKD